MRLQKLFITTLLSVSVIGTAIPANVSAASYATTKRTYTLKVAGKKQKKKARGAIYNGKTIKTKAPGFCTGEIVWNRHLYGPRQENFWNSMDTGWFGKVWMRSFCGFSTDSRSIKKDGSHSPMRWVCFWDIRWEM